MICNNPNSFGSGFIGDSAGGGFGSGLSSAPHNGDGFGSGPFAYAISGGGIDVIGYGDVTVKEFVALSMALGADLLY
jgi:hypothetical protein